MPDPRDPVEDLERIAFLLERALEPTYRVRALRGGCHVHSDWSDGGSLSSSRGVTWTGRPGHRSPAFVTSVRSGRPAAPGLFDGAPAYRPSVRETS